MTAGNDPKRFEKVRTEQRKEIRFLLGVKAKGIVSCAYAGAGGRRRPFKLQNLRFLREWVGHKKGPPKYYISRV